MVLGVKHQYVRVENLTLDDQCYAKYGLGDLDTILTHPNGVRANGSTALEELKFTSKNKAIAVSPCLLWKNKYLLFSPEAY